ncbi:MAG: c-type cytochrome [Rubrivivax sp.]|nr:c-type cytochrome [Rubrivivax sp.]
MSSFRKSLTAALLALSAAAAFAQASQPSVITGLGRPATPKEIAAWDIDVRPDFKGLPKGSGSVAKGMDVWESKCASCHGVFGESNETFSPLVGGTTKDDIRTGRVARLLDESFPGRTTMMKVSTVSTLWDYINRAMPWNNPKTLTTEEVYAVTAYLLNMGGVLPDNFTLSDRNIAEVQKLLPNRNGKTTDHGMWPGRTMGNGGKPDVRAVACMKDCVTEPRVRSFLPDHARNAHGNLAEQNRMIGAQLGADTTKPPGAPFTAPAAPAAGSQGAGAAAAPADLFKKYSCNACHGVENKLVGPGLREIAKKYAGRSDAVDYLGGKIVSGGTGVWGAIPMPAQTLPPADAKALARWIAEGAKP